jgi:hypothetical protein
MAIVREFKTLLAETPASNQQLTTSNFLHSHLRAFDDNPSLSVAFANSLPISHTFPAPMVTMRSPG